VEASGEECPAPIEAFADIALHPLLKANIELNKFAKPTPVQRHSLPIGLARRDLMACAQTGSGKTGGFLFPVLHQMLTEMDAAPDDFNQRGRAEPRCLILAPTRELATQILRETQKFAQQSHVNPVVVYGGAEIRTQITQLERGCSLLVATPGRLCDLIERGKVSLAKVRFLVLDEADRMLDMGFEPQIRRVVEHEGMPTSETRQTLMFSATFPKEIQKLASEFMTRYIFVAVGRVGSTTALITQTVLWTEEQEKHRVLVELLAAHQGRTIIFVETKRAAEQLEDFLYRSNVPATSIHGDRTQRERENALLAFRKGAPATLVATDVAARGLDVPDCVHVINYELPRDINSYVHRIGRTGRMGRQGNATSLFSWANKGVARELVSLLQEAQQQCPEWLAKLASESGAGSRGYGGGGRGKFGGRDYRANAQVRQYHHSGGGGGAPGAYGHGQQGGMQAQAGYGGRGMGYGMAQGYAAMPAKQSGGHMGGMYSQVDGGAGGWASWAGQMGMAAPAGGYPQQIAQGGRAGGYGVGVGPTQESWMAQQAQYAQYYSQQPPQGYSQQAAQGYAQQQAATGGESGGGGGMVPIGGIMWPQSQQMQAAPSGQEGQYSSSYAMQPPQ